MRKIPLVEVSGDYYDIGYQIGEALKSNIKKTIKFPIKIAKEHQYFKIDYFVEVARKYFPYANKYFPNLVTELKGISDGSDQDFDMIWLLNIEEVLIDNYFDKCTSIVFREVDDKIYLYHNEDFEKYYSNNMAVVKANVNNKVKFLSLTFAGMLPGSSVSLNSFGLIQCINSLHTKDYRLGIPKNFISRAVLEVKNINEALKIIKLKYRASAYNHILIHKNDVVDVETTAVKYKLFSVKDKVFVHTNHYLHKKFFDNEDLLGSKWRYNSIFDIIKNSKVIDKNTFVNILSYHGKDFSVCKHVSKSISDVTLASVIVDSSDLKMCIAKGGPCKNKHEVYSLE